MSQAVVHATAEMGSFGDYTCMSMGCIIIVIRSKKFVLCSFDDYFLVLFFSYFKFDFLMSLSLVYLRGPSKAEA